MGQAIRTTYHGPTMRQPARIVAYAFGGRATVMCAGSEDVANEHRYAATALAVDLGWSATWIGGVLPDGSMVWVATDGPTFETGKRKT